MEVIKEYEGSKQLKRIYYDCNDAELLKKIFTELKPETIDRLCKHLGDNNTYLDADDCYDAQSGWFGTDIYIGENNANLSLNGYCLSDNSINLFLDGGQNPMWYHTWSDDYKLAKTWQETKQ